MASTETNAVQSIVPLPHLKGCSVTWSCLYSATGGSDRGDAESGEQMGLNIMGNQWCVGAYIE